MPHGTLPKHIVRLLRDAAWALSREADQYAEDDRSHARILYLIADRCQRAAIAKAKGVAP